MARCASFTDLSHKHMYLDEKFPTPAFQLSFALIEPSHLLTVAVAIFKTEGGISSKCTTSAFNCTTAKVLIGSAVALEASRIRGSLPTPQNSRETRATTGELLFFFEEDYVMMRMNPAIQERVVTHLYVDIKYWFYDGDLRELSLCPFLDLTPINDMI
ncbi:hypothetical protein PsorP6_001295 [Peronosclerospora sorghi]|uniref:Uncharacterized protein n=1 Tax=Peronosclerospora sorghi TaxID=230839 RepID=A0ACC0WSM0_9STRA|nr:hypothetical protein PsorP6_001295 [Peronosclerospora sorghi]